VRHDSIIWSAGGGLLRRNLRLAQPMIEKGGEPSAPGGVVDCAIREMRDPRLSVGQQRAFMTARGPSAHHSVGHVGMKLQREGSAAVAKRMLGTSASRIPPCARSPWPFSSPPRCTRPRSGRDCATSA